ncbi:hypothetical protein D8T45_07655 [Vibrio vulnificus]|nr:hypothetical protein [Vibrio vulnificus]RZP67156.1 hypothetical protein D8T45_07655 [Vibrio vulnificus]RZR08407.1 hypothetical protein D8T24_21565 [Vibrio vulnificus]
MVASFLCLLGFPVLVLSASRLQWSLFSGLQFVGAKNSESCLIEMQCLGEVSEVFSISMLEFQFSVFHAKTQC